MERFIEMVGGVNNGRTVMSYGHLVGNAPESVTIIHTVHTCSHESEVSVMFYYWYVWQMSVHLHIPDSATPRLYWLVMNHRCSLKDVGV